MIWVVEAEYIREHRLKLTFSDGAAGEVDLGPMIAADHRPIARQLLDESLFKRFSVAMDTVVWENGFDLAPEYLRKNLSVTAAA